MLTSEISPQSSNLIFYVNGKKVVEKSPDPETTLLHYLRHKLRLTGTKLGCGEGGCGACTVMISRYNRHTDNILHYSVNACLYPLCSVHGLAVTTVEGIGSTAKGLHPVQERIAKSHGSQCGFCTPGIVMSMYTLLRNSPVPSVEEMERSFDGNLCRCTGYRPILDGFRTFTKECAMGKDCCKSQTGEQNGHVTGLPNGSIQNGLAEASQAEGISSTLYKASDFCNFDPIQEPIFPPELQLSNEFDNTALRFEGERVTWLRPVSLAELLQLKSTYPDSRLVIGNSEIGVEMKFKDMYYPVLIATTHIPELLTVQQTASGVRFGASTTLSAMESTLQKMVKSLPEYKTRIFAAIIEMLKWFAGHQIRNVAALAGNIMTASPISDLNPILLSAGAILQVQSKDGGSRNIRMDHNFFKGYRKTAVEPHEVLISVEIPYTRETEFFYAYKQAHRRDDDIAIVNSGMRVLFEEGSTKIKELALSYGGMAPTTLMATKSMNMALGRFWEDDLITDMCTTLTDDLLLPPGAPGGMTEYRQTLTTSFFFKFYLSVLLELQKQIDSAVKNKVPSSYKSATPIFHRDPTQSLQLYETVAPGQWREDPVGRPVAHLSALKQATGEAVYVDDLSPNSNELYLAIVRSTKAHAKILQVDPTKALSMPGVEDYICYKDIPRDNMWGSIRHDEEIFATEKVTCQGQTIGAILADTQAHAQRAAKVVLVEYKELDKIITIADAIKAKSFIEPTGSVQKGDLMAGFKLADHTLEGEMHVGGQEHFYLETQACLVIPHNEDGEMEVISSTQNITEGQRVVASALGVPDNRVVCKAKRLGGGFGGKESRSSALAAVCAVAAQKSGKSVRCMLDRDEDMCSTGMRHPFLGRYKVGFTKEGKLTALKLEMYSNAGNSLDLSSAVMERALFHFCNCYHVPNLQAKGYLCRTNTPSNTAFRGFGAPQAMLICEHWINEIAHELSLPPEQVRQVNMFHEGDVTHYNQVLNHYHLPTCWRDCHNQSGFDEQRKEVNLFNSENRWKKRGLSMVPTQFGVAFTCVFLNQGGALLHVYTDGSVLLAHGGVEMGQGLHTKMIQVASRSLGIPATRIHISETSTDKVPNTPATAASMGSDINGMAVMDACHKIRARLEPYMATNPKGSWDDWVKAAYFGRVSLSATGYYKVPGLTSDDQNNRGNPFSYFTTGVACSQVEIDCLTGDHKVLRTDIVMDIGTSLNPAIDIGQIEGGFTQGYGLMMMEQLKVMPSGYLLTRGPGNYKIPSFGDIPIEFNVTLLKGVSNPKAVYSSKAIGEPPLFLAASVFFAVKDAIMAARMDAGLHGNFPLNSPATPERIRMACADQFTQQFPSAKAGSYQPWFVDL